MAYFDDTGRTPSVVNCPVGVAPISVSPLQGIPLGVFRLDWLWAFKVTVQFVWPTYEFVRLTYYRVDLYRIEHTPDQSKKVPECCILVGVVGCMGGIFR